MTAKEYLTCVIQGMCDSREYLTCMIQGMCDSREYLTCMIQGTYLVTHPIPGCATRYLPESWCQKKFDSTGGQEMYHVTHPIPG